MARDPAYRRYQARQAKKRAGMLFRLWGCNAIPYSPEFRDAWIGKMANCHGVPCSCFMCGNPRRNCSLPTLAEIRAERSMRDTLKDEFGLSA